MLKKIFGILAIFYIILIIKSWEITEEIEKINGVEQVSWNDEGYTYTGSS